MGIAQGGAAQCYSGASQVGLQLFPLFMTVKGTVIRCLYIETLPDGELEELGHEVVGLDGQSYENTKQKTHVTADA